MKKLVVVSVVAAVLYGAAARAEDQTVKLQDVVVTATKTAKNPDDVTQSVTVVTADEIKRSGATDVATAIQNSVSVHIQNYGTPGAVESVNLRGSYSSQVLVLLDGIRMNSSRDGGFDLSFIPVSVDDIDRIEIVRGPASALYGTDAMGGVINIITKKPQANKTTVSASVGSHGYDDLFLNNSGREGGWYYSLSGERETSDGYRQNSDAYQWTTGGKVGYDLSKTDSVEVTANYLSRDNGVPGALEFPSPRARQNERNAVLGANYHAKLGSSIDLNLSGYRKQDDLTFRDPDTVTFDRFQTTSSGEETRVSWLLASWNQLTAGYELRRDSLDRFDALLGADAHSASLAAYFAQDEINIGEDLIVDIGGRHDRHSVFGEKFSPKASARYLLRSTGTIVRGSYGKSFRAPTFNDLYWPSSSSSFFGMTFITQGNPALVPERAKEYEAGIEQPLGKGTMVKVAVFRRKVDNLITWLTVNSGPTTFITAPQNVGKVDIRGWETEAALRLSETVAAAVNYTYLNPVDEVTGQKIYYLIPQWELKSSLTIALDPDVHLTADWRAVQNYVQPGQPAWRYQVLDAKIAEKIGRDKRSEVYFAMSNVLDRQYDSIRSSYGASYPAAPREIRGGVTFTF